MLARWRLAFRAMALCWAVSAGQLLPAGPAGGQEAGAQGREWAKIDAETVTRRQPLLLEVALSTLQGTHAGESPQLFFVGFAGYGPEAVFKREVLAVRDLFDVRFGTKGRSLVLINHASTLDDIALASLTNLDRALQHIGAVMNKDNDVLFLFLTSHGQKNRFALEMPGFALDSLTPGHLKGMLDRSGIKNRVVVVSACHSGSFVPALADPTTLVITAAHAERTSFGCEDRRQWTYFGDAFFNRSLRQERSFERAFERARRMIGRWEMRERLVRSLPQIAGGEALRPRLDQLAARSGARE